jgi:hypothetical protein
MVLDHVPQPILVRLMALDDYARGVEEFARAAENKVYRARDILNGRTNVSAEKLLETKRDFDAVYKHSGLMKDHAKVEAAIVAGVKVWLEALPSNTKLEQVHTSPNGRGLAQIREQMAALREEVRELQQAPVPSADLEQRLAEYVSNLAIAARPVIWRGLSGGDLDIRWPGERKANRHNLAGFDTEFSNGLLMCAFLQPELLLQRLMAEAKHVCSIPCPPEARPTRIAELEEQLDQLGYVEEACVTRAQNDGESVTRFRDAKPWHVLMVKNPQTEEVRRTAVPTPRPHLERELRTAAAE